MRRMPTRDPSLPSSAFPGGPPPASAPFSRNPPASHRPGPPPLPMRRSSPHPHPDPMHPHHNLVQPGHVSYPSAHHAGPGMPDYVNFAYHVLPVTAALANGRQDDARFENGRQGAGALPSDEYVNSPFQSGGQGNMAYEHGGNGNMAYEHSGYGSMGYGYGSSVGMGLASGGHEGGVYSQGGAWNGEFANGCRDGEGYRDGGQSGGVYGTGGGAYGNGGYQQSYGDYRNDGSRSRGNGKGGSGPGWQENSASQIVDLTQPGKTSGNVDRIMQRAACAQSLRMSGRQAGNSALGSHRPVSGDPGRLEPTEGAVALQDMCTQERNASNHRQAGRPGGENAASQRTCRRGLAGRAAQELAGRMEGSGSNMHRKEGTGLVGQVARDFAGNMEGDGSSTRRKVRKGLAGPAAQEFADRINSTSVVGGEAGTGLIGQAPVEGACWMESYGFNMRGEAMAKPKGLSTSPSVPSDGQKKREWKRDSVLRSVPWPSVLPPVNDENPLDCVEVSEGSSPNVPPIVIEDSPRQASQAETIVDEDGVRQASQAIEDAIRKASDMVNEEHQPEALVFSASGSPSGDKLPRHEWLDGKDRYADLVPLEGHRSLAGDAKNEIGSIEREDQACDQLRAAHQQGRAPNASLLGVQSNGRSTSSDGARDRPARQAGARHVKSETELRTPKLQLREHSSSSPSREVVLTQKTALRIPKLRKQSSLTPSQDVKFAQEQVKGTKQSVQLSSVPVRDGSVENVEARVQGSVEPLSQSSFGDRIGDDGSDDIPFGAVKKSEAVRKVQPRPLLKKSIRLFDSDDEDELEPPRDVQGPHKAKHSKLPKQGTTKEGKSANADPVKRRSPRISSRETSFSHEALVGIDLGRHGDSRRSPRNLGRKNTPGPKKPVEAEGEDENEGSDAGYINKERKTPRRSPRVTVKSRKALPTLFDDDEPYDDEPDDENSDADFELGKGGGDSARKSARLAGKSKKRPSASNLGKRKGSRKVKKHSGETPATESPSQDGGSQTMHISVTALRPKKRRKVEFPDYVRKRMSPDELSTVRLAFVKFYPPPPSNMQAQGRYEQMYGTEMSAAMINGLWKKELEPWSKRWWDFYSSFNIIVRQKKLDKPAGKDPTVTDGEANRWAKEFHSEHGDARLPAAKLPTKDEGSRRLTGA